MAKKNMASNLAELMIGDCGMRFLTVNGFSVNGSDYDRFRRLCVCVERDPSHPFSLLLQQNLLKTFSISLPLSPQNCSGIWREISCKFWIGDFDLTSDEWKTSLEILPPQVSETSLKNYLDVRFLQTEATDWQTWKTEAENLLSRYLKDGMDFLISFPSDFQFEKPNLYRVERHLSGIEPNDQIWSAQLLYFLCDFCYRRGVRCRIDWLGDCHGLLDVLRYVSKLTPIPNLLLRCELPAAAPLLSICELVMAGRMDRNDALGVPPVLLVGKQAT